jgi:hypothetical protein
MSLNIFGFNKMKVLFDEPTHTYTNNNTDEKYISVTTLIHKYTPEFDSDYWSLYKAVKDILSNNNCFDAYKRSVGGWESVVPAWNSNPLLKFKDDVDCRQQHYLLQWEAISETACEIGTAEHKRREIETAENNYYTHENEQYETPKVHNQQDILHIQDFHSNRIYTELLVYNDRYKVAGQVDWVRKKGRQVWIKDYKTSKEITKEAFREEKLLAPLSDLYNANWYIYAMQLSTYGWMLEECGYTVAGLNLIHTRTETTYNIPYLKDHVQAMMQDYAEF